MNLLCVNMSIYLHHIVTKIMDDNDVAFIPIGDACGISYQLQKYGLRRYALPFDWLKIKRLSDITKIINNNFSDFTDFRKDGTSTCFPYLNTDNFDSDGLKQTFKAVNSYGVISYHDFTSNIDFEEQISNIKEKYNRRINRFYEIIRSNKKIVFIRDEGNPKQSMNNDIIEFIGTIKKINESINFNIIIICRKNIPNIKIPNVTIIHDKNEFIDWTRPNIDWESIFNFSKDEKIYPSDE